MRVALVCSRAAKRRCKGKLTIKTRKQRGRPRLLARGRFAIRRGKQKRVTLRIRRSLRARTSRAARKRRGYRVVAVISTRTGRSRAPLTLVTARR